MSRRFTTGSASHLLSLFVCFAGIFLGGGERLNARPIRQPNIVWITCEDISANLGCYGDCYAVTPNLDRLAEQSVRYTRAFATIGVCAPARSSIITGMYPPSIGSQHMRCQTQLPASIRCFPEYLRESGYYCTNNSKTDYNFRHSKTVWDESSREAHWRHREQGQPFFSVFNFTVCHESRIRQPLEKYRKLMAEFEADARHDPAGAPIPPYHPDTAEVRRDWARYYDMITVMDRQIAGVLDQLEQDELADDTIVFYYSDHGAGMPRSKRWLYDSSLHVPLLIRFGRNVQHLAPAAAGTTSDRLVSFVDFAPTVLSLAGMQPPAQMQGSAFLGEHAGEPREYIFGFRDRMDERYDMLRCVRDKRFKYIRNYMPHLPWFGEQYISYMYQMPTMDVWQRMADEGSLTGPAAVFMQHQKPSQELYDTQSDPWEVNNLAEDPAYASTIERMRGELTKWSDRIIDLGYLPEAELRTRFGDEPPYAAVRESAESYPLSRIRAAAELATDRDRATFEPLRQLAGDADPAVRYWAMIGFAVAGDQSSEGAAVLVAALGDASASVRMAAADALCRRGQFDRALPVLAAGMTDPNEWVRLAAVNSLDRIDEQARPLLPQLRVVHKDSQGYVARVLEHLLEPF